MFRKLLLPLLCIMIAGYGAATLALVSDSEPVLGLDLQGGVSVVLQPKADASTEALDQTVDIIRRRVDGLGVAEPDISRQGDTIVVQLPGVKDQQQALDLVGRTGKLSYRPVTDFRSFGQYPVDQGTEGVTTETTIPVDGTVTPNPNASTTIPVTTVAESTTTAVATSSIAGSGGPGRSATLRQADETTTPVAPAPNTEGLDPTLTPTPTVDPAAGPTPDPNGCPAIDTVTFALTPADQIREDCPMIARAVNADDVETGRYALAAQRLPGTVIKAADVSNQGGSPRVVFEIRDESIDDFDTMASENLNKQVAFELDGVVVSAPVFNTSDFNGRGEITGDFTQQEAESIAQILRYGALPVELEPASVRTVSASLGSDSLRAGLFAGIGGLVLVLLYMIVYYRALGLVVVLGLTVSGSLMYGIVTYLGATEGLALSLAGVIGIVISVGVVVDSYVVYFERLKEEVRNGRSVKSSVDKGFARAFKTIIAADTSSFIGAILLYSLSVGPVRGFAFFLALSTALDVLVAYFFTRPVVALLSRSKFFTTARFFGVARGLGARDRNAGPVDEDQDREGRGIIYKLYNGLTRIDFVGRRKIWFSLSAFVILLGALSIGTKGLNFSIDFRGGTSFEFTAAESVSVDDVRSALEPVGLGSAKIQELRSQTDDTQRLIRVQGDEPTVSNAEVQKLLAQTAGLNDAAGVADPNQVSVTDVGPSWGQSITNQAWRALIVFLVAIGLYITIRFESKMALAALAAVVHDIIVTIGIYSLSGFEVTPATISAFLTILGYSLYDTIVVFDKINENVAAISRSSRGSFTDVVNRAMNQVLMRSLNTSFTALLPIASVLIVGVVILNATTLQDFGLAMLIGLATGAYSSIFIAAPILAMLKNREPRWSGERGSTHSATRTTRSKVDDDDQLVGAGALTPAKSRPTPPAGSKPSDSADASVAGMASMPKLDRGPIAPRPSKRRKS
jgi:protein-export membrane protein SecD/preprotein translocase SecF subunit